MLFNQVSIIFGNGLPGSAFVAVQSRKIAIDIEVRTAAAGEIRSTLFVFDLKPARRDCDSIDFAELLWLEFFLLASSLVDSGKIAPFSIWPTPEGHLKGIGV
ncbi:MAG: hypothetical protein ABS49_13375 [Erythrobacter sp. SCN 62-14]|nr:MAG: hypothetical protein ABS49_13375 [Erythrobacter sp. SCN 62-14]